ncbi:hypothetical protein INT43_003599 [Umbelopsis isabellina]|uniref:FAD-binding domain-containing protein n=1 Tax=Mortierella isabellina TaxID=91625 RepID=A0A8H7PTH8_MORIS|nr:hypothetical protein INT43_003599 [Umbelopsis isabellina]
MTDIIDVLICGAGPVGCFFANLMEQAGHNFRIIDNTTFESRRGQSRALLLTARSLEILHDRGLSGDILRAALILHGFRLYTPTKQAAQVEMGQLDTPFPHITTIPQWKLEEALISNLKTKIERPATVLSYVQESDHVVAKVQHGDDKDNIEEIRARYLVGSDGVHSAVRKGIEGWTFNGVVVNAPFAIADVELEGENPPSDRHLSFVNSPKGSFGFIPMAKPDGEGIIYRILFNVERIETYSDDGSHITQGIKTTHDFTEKEMEEMLTERASPFKFEIKKTLWVSKFGVNERKANGFRRGRAFIIGDAAHCHSPAGGQGMNLGLQDAYNLAWKISAILNNTVKDPEQLLESYHLERVEQVDKTIEATGKALRTQVTSGIMSDFMRTFVLPVIVSIPSIQGMAGHVVQQLYVTIPTKSPLLAMKTNSTIIEPGKFFTDTGVIYPKNTIDFGPNTIKQILQKSYRHVALLIWNGCGSEEASEPFWKLLEVYQKCVRPVVIASTIYVERYRVPPYGANSADGQTGFWADPRGSLGKKLGIPDKHAGIILLRPDMYVAFSADYKGNSPLPLEPLKAYLDQHFKSAS